MKLKKFCLPWLAAIAGLMIGACAVAAAEDWEALPNGGQGRLAMFEGKDGVKIAGYVRKPAGDGPFPLVIVLHGGAPTAKATAGGDGPEKEAVRASRQLGRAANPPLSDFLAQGWAVYTIDYRPAPRYTLDPAEWDDTLIAIAQARAFSFVDRRRIALYGGSHGGHVVGRMITRTEVTCAVLCAPAGLDLILLSQLAAQGTPIGANQRLVREMEQRTQLKMADIAKDPAGVHYSSLLTEAATVRCPILLISGKNDPNAPLPAMNAYVEKVRAAGKTAETYHPDNGPHGFYVGLPKTIPETAEATRQTVAFIKKQFEGVAP
jgi:dipeptidyl aminopeptidase/acylaminoacyl peptidase